MPWVKVENSGAGLEKGTRRDVPVLDKIKLSESENEKFVLFYQDYWNKNNRECATGFGDWTEGLQVGSIYTVGYYGSDDLQIIGKDEYLDKRDFVGLPFGGGKTDEEKESFPLEVMIGDALYENDVSKDICKYIGRVLKAKGLDYSLFNKAVRKGARL